MWERKQEEGTKEEELAKQIKFPLYSFCLSNSPHQISTPFSLFYYSLFCALELDFLQSWSFLKVSSCQWYLSQ